MAALTAIIPTLSGATSTGAAVAASDTITAAQVGTLGCLLEILNGGGSPDTVAISDASLTPAGNASATSGGSVSNGANKVFYISPKAVNLSTGVVTVTHSFTTTVTYKLYSLG